MSETDDVIEYSANTMEILGITNNGLNGLFDDCYDLIPCVNETNLIDPNGIVYGISIFQ